jgi:CheY-like chemotaxis protein/HPt (histidine-containing phosphotransfer) domain-containing protein
VTTDNADLTPQRADATMASRHPLRILLAEDNTINEQLALRMLGRLGYSADVARNGQEALDAVTRQSYDLVLMDLQMPVMDGIVATRHIRSTVAAAQQPWIIALTANNPGDERERCLAAGMDDYVSKPVGVRMLTNALLRCTRRTQSTAPAPAVEPSQIPADEPPQPPIDLGRLRAMLGKQAAAVLPSLIATFTTEAERLQGEAQAALAMGDSSTLRRVAHTLKSNSATVGARTLERLCLELERKAAAGELDDAPARLAQIVAQYKLVREALTTADLASDA